MILVALGTQDQPFDRLLRKIDELVERGAISEPAFAQVGFSHYRPKHYDYREMLSFEEFDRLLDQCDVLISHGGTGTLVGALKRGKPVIAVPRLARYGEHVDDHQTEIVGALAEGGLLIRVDEMDQLDQALKDIRRFTPGRFVSGKSAMVDMLRRFIDDI